MTDCWKKVLIDETKLNWRYFWRILSQNLALTKCWTGETEILATPDDKYYLRHKKEAETWQGSSAFQVLTLNNDTMIFNTSQPTFQKLDRTLTRPAGNFLNK